MNTIDKQKALNELKEIENRADTLRTMINNADKKPITERVSNFADILAEAGFTHEQWNAHLDSVRKQYNIENLPTAMVPYYTKKLRYKLAEEVAELIFHIVDDGDHLSFKNSNEEKHSIWMKYDSSAGRFVFDNTRYYYTSTHAGLGPRLCLKRDKAIFVGKTFGNELNELMMANEDMI